MHFERLMSAAHPLYGRAMELYRVSFPPHERREALSQERILADADYHFALACDGDTFVGLALFWETDGFVYVEHLCIVPELRGRRYGGQVLELLGQRGRVVILEIDPPVDDISRRRQGFYERSGFVVNPYPHVHPPYHAGCAGHGLVVMSSPRAISAEEYAAFSDYLAGRVMKGAY